MTPTQVVDGATDNVLSAAFDLIPGNTYAVQVKSPTATYDSGVVTVEQTFDDTNFYATPDFSSMGVDGMQTFVAMGTKGKFRIASVAAAGADIDIDFVDLGGLHSRNKDYSRHDVTVTNS